MAEIKQIDKYARVKKVAEDQKKQGADEEELKDLQPNSDILA